MLPAIEIGGINALPCGIEAEPTVDEVNYQAFSLPEAFMLRIVKKELTYVDDICIMLRVKNLKLVILPLQRENRYRM